MPQCQLNLLGGWSLIVDGGAELPLPTRKDKQLLAHTKVDSTVRYLGVELEDALSIAEKIDI